MCLFVWRIERSDPGASNLIVGGGKGVRVVVGEDYGFTEGKM